MCPLISLGFRVNLKTTPYRKHHIFFVANYANYANLCVENVNFYFFCSAKVKNYAIPIAIEFASR